MLKKEYGTTAATKPDMHKKAPAKRVPMSKPRKVPTGETMKFTIESDACKAIGDGKTIREPHLQKFLESQLW